MARPVRRGPVRPVGVRGDEAAVSDVLGSILLVGITVIMAGGFAVLLLSFDGPEETLHSRLATSMASGGGDWGDGDEQLRLTHLGGEPLKADEVTIQFARAGVVTTLTGDALGSAFDDGELTIGETWITTLTADVGDVVEVRVVHTGNQSQLLASGSIVAGASGGAACLVDTALPSAGWVQSPPDVDSLTNGSVTVTVTIADGCSGVDDSVAPHLWWCVAITCTVGTSFFDAGAMQSVGTHQWSGSVPHGGSWLADAVAGRTLNYYVANLTDVAGNSGFSAVQTDALGFLATYTYVASGVATTGTQANLANAQTPSDGTEATLTEGAVAGSAGTAGPTKFSGATASTGGAVNQNNVLTSNDVWAELDTTGDLIEVTGFDLPADAVSVTALTIGYEGRKDSPGGGSPATRIDYKTTGGYTLGTAGNGLFTESATADTDRTKSVSGFSVADVEAMTIRVVLVADENRNPLIDHVFARVTYTTSPPTNYRLDAQLNWTGVPSGTVQNVELRYRTLTDTFNVQVWNFATSTWRTCTGALSSATLTSYSCPLTLPAEYSSGAVRVRFTDATPTGTSQGQLFLDHARMASA